MIINVFLIDDQDGKPDKHGKPGKRMYLDAFLSYLNKTFKPFEFVKGKMKYEGREYDHNSIFASKADQINAALHDPYTLVLLDVWMEPVPFVQAAEKLLEMHPERAERANEISMILENAFPSDKTKLAGAVLAVAEKALTKIAWVSTNTPNNVLLNLDVFKIGCVPWPGVQDANKPAISSEFWEVSSIATKNLKAIFRRTYIVDSLREIWSRMAELANDGKWKLDGIETKELFPKGKYHKVSGHLNNVAAMNANAKMLQEATAEFVNKMGMPNFRTTGESLATFRASIRGNQIPLFLFQRIARLPETSDLTCALYWSEPDSMDAPSVCQGLAWITTSTPNSQGANLAKIDLKLNSDSTNATLWIEIEGNNKEVEKIEDALNLGATRRGFLLERAINDGDFNPGSFTHGIDLLAPTDRSTDKTSNMQKKLTITKSFSIVPL